MLTRVALAVAVVLSLATVRAADDSLPAGVVRGPLLHEHSFHAPLVDDWWEEGVPHFMIGGSAIANEKFLRLTTNSQDDAGFAFNTAPLDHSDWEVRVRLSVRPPPKASEAGQRQGVRYQGGDGMALWYLAQPIGDDHQHVVKYSRPITPEVKEGLLERENPWRLADQILNPGDDDEDYVPDDGIDEADLTAEDRAARARAAEKRRIRRQRREELFRRLFKRGTSSDGTDTEPRVMGVKYSDFASGFAVVLDSVGDEDPHYDTEEVHKASIFVLLNLPNHTAASGAAVRNNFNPQEPNFRAAPRLLACDYNFRQAATPWYDPAARRAMSEEQRLLAAPEEPVELVVRYYRRKLSVLVVREDPAAREVRRREEGGAGGQLPAGLELQRTFTETLCGELYPVELPTHYHLGLSAATGRRRFKDRGPDPDVEELFLANIKKKKLTHVDLHEAYRMEVRELGTDAKAMGYSKTVPLEHFDYEGDKKLREHFSRKIPSQPDADA